MVGCATHGTAVGHPVTDHCRPDLDQTEIELLLQEQKYEEAKACLSRRIDRFPFDREARLYLLLVNVDIQGPECFEDDIDELRTFYDLNQTEKNIVRRIFLLGYRAAETRGQENQTWAYQRLLRRLLLDQPLDQPIPRSSIRPLASVARPLFELGPEIHVAVPEFEKARVEPTSHRPSPPFAPIPRLARPAGLVAASIAFLITPIVYFLLGQTQETTWHAVTNTNRALHSAAENGVGIAKSEKFEHPRREITAGRDETLHKLVAPQLPNLRRDNSRRIAKNHDVTGGLLPKLKGDGTGQTTQVDEIASHLPDADFVNAITREAHERKFSKERVDAVEITVPPLFLPKQTHPGSVAHWEGTLEDAQTKNPARSSVQIAQSPPVTNKRRKVENKSRHADALRQEIAARADNRAHVPEPANAPIIVKTKRPITLREEPRFAATAVEEIAGGIPVRVLEVRGKWLKVKSASAETTGFVRKEFLTPIN